MTITNKTATEFYREIEKEYRALSCIEKTRLFHCSARYALINTERFYGVVLESYNTVVAYYDKSIKKMYVFGYWSPTTCQHISKFARLMQPEYITYFYNRSDNCIVQYYLSGKIIIKGNKREYENAYATDWIKYTPIF